MLRAAPWLSLKALASDSPYAAREALAGREARELARDLSGMTQEESSLASKRSRTKRAKLRGLKRNAAVVLGNVGSAEAVPSLVAALADPEPLVQGHAAWALGRIGSREALALTVLSHGDRARQDIGLPLGSSRGPAPGSESAALPHSPCISTGDRHTG